MKGEYGAIEDYTDPEDLNNKQANYLEAPSDYCSDHDNMRKEPRLGANFVVTRQQPLQWGSKSRDEFLQGFAAYFRETYLASLRANVRKGQMKKAERGIYLGRAPFGYVYDRKQQILAPHPSNAAVVALFFHLYSSGEYSLSELSNAVDIQTSQQTNPSKLRRILESTFMLVPSIGAGVITKESIRHSSSSPLSFRLSGSGLVGWTRSAQPGCRSNDDGDSK